MIKYSNLLLILCIGSFGLILSSCKKGDEPTVKSKLSLTTAEMTVNEADGTIEVEVKLDKPASSNLNVQYTLQGTSIEKSTVETNADYDYEDLNNGIVQFTKGQTTSTIELELASDFYIDNGTTIVIKLKDVDNEDVEITRDDETVITVNQEDGLLVYLDWDYLRADSVDMDLFLWAENQNSILSLTNKSSITPSVYAPEALFIPNAANDGTYGFSCTYYSGKVSPMEFNLQFVKFVNGKGVSSVERIGTYTSDNINPWDTSAGTDPLLAITLEKSGANFSNYSEEITVSATGSRVASSKLPAGLKRGNTRFKI